MTRTSGLARFLSLPLSLGRSVSQLRFGPPRLIIGESSPRRLLLVVHNEYKALAGISFYEE
jgi:hypothetical protein